MWCGKSKFKREEGQLRVNAIIYETPRECMPELTPPLLTGLPDAL